MTDTLLAAEPMTATPDAPSPGLTVPQPTPPGLPDLKNPGSLLSSPPAPAEAAAEEIPTDTQEPTDTEAQAPEAPPAPEAPKVPDPKLVVELPVPGRDHALAVEFATQEAADTARHILKQNARLADQMEAAQGDRATVDFLTEHPTEGLLWMAQANPESANAFLETWMRANPERAVQAVQALGFQVTADALSERAIAAEARLAKLEMDTKVREGQDRFRTTLSTTSFRAKALEVVETLAESVGLQKGTEDFEIFGDRASRRLADLYKQQQGRVTPADMTQALQPLAQRFVGHHSATQPRNEAGQFTEAPKAPADPAALLKRNDTMRKIAGSAAPVAPVPAAVSKIDPNASLYDLRKQGRGF